MTSNSTHLLIQSHIMNTTSPKSLLRKILIGLLFGFLVFLALALVGDLRLVSQQIVAFKWSMFLLALGFTLFNYTLRFFKWHFYLKQIGVNNLSIPRSARLFVAGFPLAVTPGKVGEALKGVWINQVSGVPVGKGISVVVAERISDGLAVLVLSTFGLINYPRYYPAFFAILSVLLILLIVSQVRPAALWLLGIGEKIPVVKRFAHGLREFYEGSYTLFRPGPTLVAVGLGAISWMGEGIGFYLILRGLGLEPGLDLLVSAVSILAFSTVVGAASALPGGLGASEASIAGMLAFVVGIHADTAAAATLLIRLATLWFGVGLGLITWAFSKELLVIPETTQTGQKTI
jgi:uncharacterized protein (TIRG00374 family)